MIKVLFWLWGTTIFLTIFFPSETGSFKDFIKALFVVISVETIAMALYLWFK